LIFIRIYDDFFFFFINLIIKLNCSWTDPVKLNIILSGEEVSIPKTINIKQYLSTNHFLVNNRHVVIKYSQTTQLYKQIVWQQFTAWTDWFVTSHGENIRRVASCCKYVIKLKLQIFILVEFATILILLIWQ
jgi:hypothetical protein